MININEYLINKNTRETKYDDSDGFSLWFIDFNHPDDYSILTINLTKIMHPYVATEISLSQYNIKGILPKYVFKAYNYSSKSDQLFSMTYKGSNASDKTDALLVRSDTTTDYFIFKTDKLKYILNDLVKNHKMYFTYKLNGKVEKYEWNYNHLSTSNTGKFIKDYLDGLN